MDKSKFVLLLDNGHGSNTPGKCSPDRRLLEYQWARDVVARIAALARAASIRTEIVTPETTDTPLSTRTKRVNAWCAKYGTANCLCISVHINAAGADGKWHDARGWSGWVAPKSSANSRRCAAIMYKHAIAAGLKGNRARQPGDYWTGNFAIVRDTRCPAVLTENLFQDNRADVDYLLTDAGKDTIARMHIAAIEEYIKTL